MIWIICQFLFLALPVVLVQVLYKSGIRFTANFSEALRRHLRARKLYTQMQLVLLLLFHYVYTKGHPGEFGVVLSTILCAMLASHKRTDRWLRVLQDRPRRFVSFALAALAIGFNPHLYTLSVTVSYILMAALFYPSTEEQSKGKEKQEGLRTLPCQGTGDDGLLENHHAACRDNADSGSLTSSAQSTTNKTE